MRIFVKPKEGAKIPRPENGRMLKPEGEEVDQSTYWRRRASDGDVTVTEVAQPVAPVIPKKKGDK